MNPAGLLRDRFPVTRRWAYFDHAAVAPLPTDARDVMAAWADDVRDNGLAESGKWFDRVAEIRRNFASLLRAKPTEVAFLKNTSEGIGHVAEGVRWRAGDNVVTLADEYPANLYPWMNLAGRGVELRRVPTDRGRVSTGAVAAAMDARTRLLTVSFVEYATGFRNDLAALGELCRDRGVLFFVDAIQGLGAFDLDVSAVPIDFLAADGHKWLLGPEGAAVFYVRESSLEHLDPRGVGWFSVASPWDFDRADFRLKPNAGRYESGTLNVAGILGMGASLDVLREATVPDVTAQILALTDRLCAALDKSPWSVYSSRSGEDRSGIVSLEAPAGTDVRRAKNRLRERGVIVNDRGGRIRVSPHLYNTFDEIDTLVGLLGETT